MFKSKEDPWKIATMLLAGIFIGIVLTQGYDLLEGKISGDDDKVQDIRGNQNQQNDIAQNPPTNEPIDVDLDDDAVLGEKDAPVTIVEFSDFQCPFCSRFFNDAYTEIKSKYIDTGKVKFVYRDFPLGGHAQAAIAAQAAECAGDQDAYWSMHDMLFSKTTEWSGQETASDTFKAYASDLGLETADFNKCLDEGQYATEVSDDMTYGRSIGVSGTPTFYINGKKIVGAQPFSAFETIIEEELKK